MNQNEYYYYTFETIQLCALYVVEKYGHFAIEIIRVKFIVNIYASNQNGRWLLHSIESFNWI